MKESFGEKVAEKLYGIKWKLKYLKGEIKNAEFYTRETNRIIEATKRKHPKDWRKRIGGWERDLAYYRGIKASSLKEIKKWERINQAHKLGKVI